MDDAGLTARGPHPLPLFLAMAMRRIRDDRARMEGFLEGLRRYQQAKWVAPMPPMAPVARHGGSRLLGVGGPADKPLVVVVPSLINSPRVLDLAPGRSLVRHLASRGHRTLLLDWGPMVAGERRLGLSGLVSGRLLPLLHLLPGPVSLVGYCLGGTLAVAAGQLLGERLRSLALVATPWHFDGFGEGAAEAAAQTWAAMEPLGNSLGAVPVSLLNPLFWGLDEDAVIAKFEALARRPADDAAIGWFAAVEDWANSGAPLPLAAARDLFVGGFQHDRFGRGLWRVAGEAIHPEALKAPIIDFGATGDRIVPPAARLRRGLAGRHDVAAGHVGMIVGSQAPATLFEPLSNWLHGS